VLLFVPPPAAGWKPARRSTDLQFAAGANGDALRITNPRSRNLRAVALSGPIRAVSLPPESRPTGPPHNPGVRELVAGKRRDSSPPDREHAMLGFRGWHERGYLPHRDEPGLTQF